MLHVEHHVEQHKESNLWISTIVTTKNTSNLALKYGGQLPGIILLVHVSSLIGKPRFFFLCVHFSSPEAQHFFKNKFCPRSRDEWLQEVPSPWLRAASCSHGKVEQ